MSTERDVTRIVRSWLEEGVTQLPDRVLDRVLDQLPATPQRRGFASAWRAKPMNSTLKIAFATAAVVAAVVAGVNFIPRDGSGVGGRPATAPSPILSPSPTSTNEVVRLTVAGTDAAPGTGLSFTAELPKGWTADANSAVREGQVALFASIIDNTFEDPCAHVERIPKIGSTVEARVAALGDIPRISATSPVQATLAGRAATYVELRIPASLPCDPNQFYLWQDSPNAYWWAAGSNELIRVWVLDVGDQAVTIAARVLEESSDEAKAELEEVLDSIKFDAAP